MFFLGKILFLLLLTEVLFCNKFTQILNFKFISFTYYRLKLRRQLCPKGS
jgi:hypothetical protein